MGMDEATKFWEYFEKMPDKVQLEYMNERFGELAWDISRDWEDFDDDYKLLDEIHQKYTEVKTGQTKEFVDEEDKDRYLSLCEDLFALAEDFNRDQYNDEAVLLKTIFSEIVQDLDEESLQELYDSMDSRGL